MEIVTKHIKSIISYGLIAFGILSCLFIFVKKPTKTDIVGTTKFDMIAPSSEISLPFSQEYELSNNSPLFLEVRFGDDSINKHSYTIRMNCNDEMLFEHTYTNEISNIIRLPLGKNIDKGSKIVLSISCNDGACQDVRAVQNEGKLNILEGVQKMDLRYYWYSAFIFTVGLTLLVFAKEEESHE